MDHAQTLELGNAVRLRFGHGGAMPFALADDAFNRVAFADLDTRTDQDLYDLNAALVGSADAARAEQWRSRITENLASRT